MIIPRHNCEVVRKYPLCVVVLLYASLTLSKADVQCPEPQCKCKNTTVTCTDLSYIPPLPNSTNILIFDKDSLPSLSRNSFSNITHLMITTLKLSKCAIENISFDALSDFKSKLEILDLSGNTDINKQQLSLSLKQLSRINVLTLNQINMGYIKSNYFKGMEESKLTAIHLQNNNFQTIRDQEFKVFQHLIRLDLSKNVISYAKLSGLSSLIFLKLNSNMLTKVPDFCVNGVSKFPKLRVLKLMRNLIETLNKESWSCLKSLTDLHLDNNPITDLDDNVFSQVIKLRKLYLQSMQIKHISKFAFNNSNLQILFLRHCCIKFRKINVDYENLFYWCPNLRSLILDFIDLHRVNTTSLMSMISPLNKLLGLSLQGTRLEQFPSDFFKPLISLRHLDLTSNLIREWPVTLFSNVSKLITLVMAKNKIQVIKEGYFPSSLTDNLTTLDLSANPFDCSCENLWFRKWINSILQKQPNIFSNYFPNSYKCMTPSSLVGTLLMDYNPTDEDCKLWGRVLMDIITISSAAVIVFSCIAVLYIQRWNIRYLLHIILMRNKKNTSLKEADFQYDAYIAYPDKDRSWIRNELWRELQQEKGFELFIRDKSEDPGVARCDSIVNNMYYTIQYNTKVLFKVGTIST
ncbi:hypothetical protein ACJMK2_019244 [Sinanodonta woodiana]|uniref:TIR domain-containing protein n=1 Tax=Sinanodonta woodiana TaxID=1069815 RepID=A0ABD3UFT5_SINWO